VVKIKGSLWLIGCQKSVENGVNRELRSQLITPYGFVVQIHRRGSLIKNGRLSDNRHIPNKHTRFQRISRKGSEVERWIELRGIEGQPVSEG
jgi:hypothetical protein